MVQTKEPPSLHPEIIGQVATMGDFGKYIYWKLANGWVAFGPAYPAAWAKRLKAGQTPLPQYGQYDFSRRGMDADGRPWDAKAEPWRLIFQKGGAEQFPVEQIVAFRWHLRPPYREVSFPQLEGVEIEVYECPECEAGVFSRTMDLGKHLRLGHGYARSDLTEYGREAGIVFKRERPMRVPRQFGKTVAEGLSSSEAPERNYEYRCEICGWAPLMAQKNPAFALSGHVRMKHRAAPKRGVSKGEGDGPSSMESQE